MALLNTPMDVLPPRHVEPLLLTEEEENQAEAFLFGLQTDSTQTDPPPPLFTIEAATQTDPSPQYPDVADLSCPIHEWEHLCPGSCGDFFYECCSHDGFLVFIPTRHMDVMLKELKDHLHPALKAQWSSLHATTD